MLYVAKQLCQLSFEQLMEVYREGNLENGRILAPFDSQARQLQLAEQDFHSYLAETFFPVRGAMYAVWEVEGKYVSALRLEPYRDGLLLEALATAPQERRKGYASALIRAVEEKLCTKAPLRLYAHVAKKNTPSLKTHASCGFLKISDSALYIDGSADSRCVTLLFEAPKKI